MTSSITSRTTRGRSSLGRHNATLAQARGEALGDPYVATAVNHEPRWPPSRRPKPEVLIGEGGVQRALGTRACDRYRRCLRDRMAVALGRQAPHGLRVLTQKASPNSDGSES